MKAVRSLHRADGGFTLLELLLVLGILATLAAVQLPRMNGLLTRSSVRSQAQILRMAMLTARTQAVLERREVRLVFDPGGRSYYFRVQADPVNAPEDYFAPTEGPLARRYEISASLTTVLEPQKAYLRFFPGGKQQDLDVRIQDGYGAEATVRISADDHRIRIVHGENNG